MKKDFCVITYCNEPWLDRSTHRNYSRIKKEW